MSDHRRSYGKTILLSSAVLCGIAALVGALVALATHFGPGWPWWAWSGWGLLLFGLSILLLVLGLIVLGGRIALHRDTLEARGIPYAPPRPRERQQGPAAQLFREQLRRIGLSRGATESRLDLRPGELVVVKDLDDILATLDDRGTLDGMPFTPEMTPFCGQSVRVFRRVEKLNDWVHKTGLHQVRDVVLLEGLRCDGTAHDGCQADCHLRWKESWLRRGARSAGATQAPTISRLRGSDLTRLTRRLDPDGERLVCQATELTAGTPPLAWGDPRHYLRDLLTGNVRPAPFIVGVALALFNAVQRSRGGAWFPFYTARAPKPTPQGVLNLRPGERVRVKTKAEIEPTLDADSRNRGLRFDVEMLRFCGGEYRVQSRIERLIVERTGRLLEVKNPCIILEGVKATGEYSAFNPENESIFWREIWLERVALSLDD